MARFNKKIFAWTLRKGDNINDSIYGELKKKLFAGISGKVLEIGPGTGINFRYLPAGIDWIGLEPNTYFHQGLTKSAEKKGIHFSIVAASAENTGLPDESVDAVISTLVLCSVPDQSKVLNEIIRILKKGGVFYFVEHVADQPHTFRRRMQNFSNPVNRWMADGCNCNRETWNSINSAGFSEVHLEHTMMKGTLSLHKPHIFGYAVK